MSAFGGQLEPIEVDAEGDAKEGSPTELAQSSGDEMKVKLEKRKREDRGGDRRRDHRELPVPGGEEDDELESPSKRPQRADEPFTAKEMRELLLGHVHEMKAAWRTFQGRLDHVEGIQEKQGEAIDKHGEMLGQLRTRTKVVEKDLTTQKQAHQQTCKHLDELTEEVKNMKVQWEGMQGNFGKNEITSAPVPSDPWAQYLRQHGPASPVIGVTSAPAPPVHGGSSSTLDKGETLSDEEKRTLAVGGWLRDTRKSVIDEESQQVLGCQASPRHRQADDLWTEEISGDASLHPSGRRKLRGAPQQDVGYSQGHIQSQTHPGQHEGC